MTRPLALAAAFTACLTAQIQDDAIRRAIAGKIQARAEEYGRMGRQIWEFAELGYQETKSSTLLQTELKKQGFQVQAGIGGAPTAFTATWGSGQPVIGIMGEFDALPGLSQDATPVRKPLVNGAPGHGCGHNLFGVAAMAAAISVKEYLETNKRPGTIRFYGTPAEEGGGGKIYMLRAGAFKDVDAVLTWHPGDRNQAGLGSSLANISAKFRFYGKASHAASAPERGRSSLDAIMLMAHAVDLMREHIPSATRLHYIVSSGGQAPNVVPDYAEMFMYARHPDMPVLDGIWERVINCGKGAALQTETRFEMELVNSVYNVLPNEPLARSLYRNLSFVNGFAYTAEETAFAQKLRESLPEATIGLGTQERVMPFVEPGGNAGGGGSTDVGDVSWSLPTAQFVAATWVPGVAAHTWQAVACDGMSIGTKGMLVAAKTLALTAADLFNDPATIAAAKQDFAKRRGARAYSSRVPAGAKPPLNYRELGASPKSGAY
jgi:aminobenzoyl-glutamate utilization protein B